jgi:thioredoxin-related protein
MNGAIRKRVFTIFVTLVLVSNPTLTGDKGGLTWLSFNDGLATAKKSKKKVLVDVYTDWCGWCKKMDASTYADGEIMMYLKENYVVVKLNAESTKKLTYNTTSYTEQELAAAFGITGYPTTLFLKSNGDPITKLPGYAPAPAFKKILSFIGEDHYLTEKFDDYVPSVKK